jgi:hypothetical protein
MAATSWGKVAVNHVAFLGSEHAPKPIEGYQCIDEFAFNLYVCLESRDM